MKNRKFLPVLLLILAVAAGFLGYRCYQQKLAYEAQFVYLNEVRYEKAAQELDLSGQQLEDLESLKAFTDLKELDLRASRISAEEYEQLKSWFPDTRILWDIPFQGDFYPMDTEELTITSLKAEDLDRIGYFEGLKRVSAENCPDYPLLHQLREAYPQLQVSYCVPAGGENHSYDVKSLVLPGMEAESFAAVLPYFTQLETVELTAPLAPAEQLLALMEAAPQVQFRWELELGGMVVNESTEKLDLTGIPMTVEQMDAVLPYLPSLTYVDMTDCGISNEEMDALNRRYEDIKIVWTVDIGRIMRVKTDEIWFMPGKWNYWVGTRDVYNLRYCTDMICVDIGHMPVENCEWAAFMPHLKYLLVADTKITDLSPIAGLQELVFLEFFLTDVTDYSPLLELPALEDVNLHYTYGDYEIIKQLTWVKNIWWRNINLSEAQRQELRDAIPGAHFEFWSYGSTGKGWRKLQNYYDHRDIMGMYYMD